jgi:hypothetical protein
VDTDHVAREDRRRLFQTPQGSGLEVAIKAPRDLIKSRKGQDGLNKRRRYAEIDRVRTERRPYIEAMVS